MSKRPIALLAGAGAGAVVIGAVLGAASRVPFGPSEGGQAAELRLSWRIRSEPERVCRRRTPEELARLPLHMREEEVCERRLLPYRLRVMAGDSVMADRLVAASGARSDRPLYVFAQFRLSPGAHPVRIDFAREGGRAPQDAAVHGRSGDSPTHALPGPVPLRLTLDTALAFVAGRALVVTFDEQQQRLRVIGETGP